MHFCRLLKLERSKMEMFADKNGGFRKRFLKWRLLKPVACEEGGCPQAKNRRSTVLVSTAKNVGFSKTGAIEACAQNSKKVQKKLGNVNAPFDIRYFHSVVWMVKTV